MIDQTIQSIAGVVIIINQVVFKMVVIQTLNFNTIIIVVIVTIIIKTLQYFNSLSMGQDLA